MFHDLLVSALHNGCDLPRGLFTHITHLTGGKSAHCINQALRLRMRASGKFPFDLAFCAHCASDIEIFGQELIRNATACLPDIFIADNDRQITRSKLVQMWQNGSRSTRIEIGRLLATTFYPRKHKDGRTFDNSDGHDSHDQPMERVLPKLYGKWLLENGVDNRPNCLGKFQLLLAMGEIFKVKMLAITPLFSSSKLLQRYREIACKKIIECLEKTGIDVGEKRLQSLLKIINHTKDTEKLPPLQHFAVIYEIGNNDWMIVDPNSGLASIMEERDELDSIFRNLETHKNDAPGASIIFKATESPPYKESLKQLSSSCETIIRISKIIFASTNWQDLRKIFIENGLAKQMLEQDLNPVTNFSLQQKFDGHALMLWKRFNCDCPDSIENLSEAEFYELRSTMVYRYLVRHEKEMLEQYNLHKTMGRIIHPLNEISRPHFRSAHATISHVALDLSENPEISNQTERILYTFGIAEASLYNVVCTSGGFCEHANRAWQILLNQQSHGELARGLFPLKGEGYVYS